MARYPLSRCSFLLSALVLISENEGLSKADVCRMVHGANQQSTRSRARRYSALDRLIGREVRNLNEGKGAYRLSITPIGKKVLADLGL